MNRSPLGVAQNQATFPSGVIGIIFQDLSVENSRLYIGQGNVLSIALFFRMKADLVLSLCNLLLNCMDFRLGKECSMLEEPVDGDPPNG